MVEENEEIEWKIPEESETEEEKEEESEEEVGVMEGAEPLAEELENIIETPTPTFIRRTDAEQITPFLEATEEPIENLEQDLQGVPGQNRGDIEGAEPLAEEQTTYTVNVPQYGDRETNYEIIQEAQRPADTEMADMSLMRRETDLMGTAGMQDQRINFARWQQTNVERGPEQQERYVRETKRIKEEDKLPFQRKRKRLF